MRSGFLNKQLIGKMINFVSITVLFLDRDSSKPKTTHDRKTKLSSTV